MKVVDLTLPIIPHWRYALQEGQTKSFAKGDDCQVTAFTLQTHWYTHIDAPLHHVPGGKTLDEFPLDLLVGEALVLDISDVGDDEAVTPERLERALGGREPRSIVLLKSCRARHCDWTSTDFWDHAPYVTEEAANWLRDLQPRVVGFDFPQDHDIRLQRLNPTAEKKAPTHDVLLANGILMIEYMYNMWGFSQDVIRFVGLPLALHKSDGAPIRCVALVD